MKFKYFSMLIKILSVFVINRLFAKGSIVSVKAGAKIGDELKKLLTFNFGEIMKLKAAIHDHLRW